MLHGEYVCVCVRARARACTWNLLRRRKMLRNMKNTAVAVQTRVCMTLGGGVSLNSCSLLATSSPGGWWQSVRFAVRLCESV